MVDVKTTFLEDVICQVADVIATIRWCVWFLGLCLVVDGIAMGLF